MKVLYILLLGLNIINIAESIVSITTSPADGIICIGDNLLINCSTSTPGITAVPCMVIENNNACEISNRIVGAHVQDDNLEQFKLINVSMYDHGQTIRCQSHVNNEYSQHSITIKVIDDVPVLQEFIMCRDDSDLIISLSPPSSSSNVSDSYYNITTYKTTVKYSSGQDPDEQYILQLQDYSKLTLDGFFNKALSHTEVIIKVSAFIQLCPSLLNYVTSTIVPSDVNICAVSKSSSLDVVSSTAEIMLTSKESESSLTNSDIGVEYSSTFIVPSTAQHSHIPDLSVNPGFTPEGVDFTHLHGGIVAGSVIVLIIIISIIIIVVVIVVVCFKCKHQTKKLTNDKQVRDNQYDGNERTLTMVSSSPNNGVQFIHPDRANILANDERVVAPGPPDNEEEWENSEKVQVDGGTRRRKTKQSS